MLYQIHILQMYKSGKNNLSSCLHWCTTKANLPLHPFHHPGQVGSGPLSGSRIKYCLTLGSAHNFINVSTLLRNGTRGGRAISAASSGRRGILHSPLILADAFFEAVCKDFGFGLYNAAPGCGCEGWSPIHHIWSMRSGLHFPGHLQSPSVMACYYAQLAGLGMWLHVWLPTCNKSHYQLL